METVRCQQNVQVRQVAAQHVCPAAGMKCRVIVAGFDPFDVGELHHFQHVAAPNDEMPGFDGNAQALFRALQDAPEALVIKGFQQIVERAHFEGSQRELMVGGDEDDGKRRRRADPLKHFESVAFRHFDVQKELDRPTLSLT